MNQIISSCISLESEPCDLNKHFPDENQKLFF
jgi:hypothetical protein